MPPSLPLPAMKGSDGVTAILCGASARTRPSSVHRGGTLSQAQSESGWVWATCSPSVSVTMAWRAWVVERLPGNATTDFGAPDVALSSDSAPIDAAGLKRYGEILQASWGALDGAISAAEGKELRKGPRGGGRELEAITRHVLGAEQGYLGRLAWKAPRSDDDNLNEEMRLTRQAIMDALSAAVRGEIPKTGPRGGVMWPARYFIRRVVWHVLDHAWEIEDRIV